MTRIRKTIVASLAALAMAGAVASSATPAAAWGWKHHHHGWGGAGIAAGVIGGLTLGAIAASAADRSDTCVVRQRVYNDYGDFVGYRRVRVAC